MVGSVAAFAERAKLDGLSIVETWLPQLAGRLEMTAGPESLDAAIDDWANTLEQDARFAAWQGQTALRAAMAGALMVAVVEPIDDDEDARARSWRDAGDAFLGMPYEDALASFRAAKVMTPEEFAELSDRFRAGGFTAARITSQTMRERAKAAILSGIEGDLTFEGIVRAIRDGETSLGITPQSDAYIETVVRTSVMTAYGHGKWRAMNQPEMLATRGIYQILGIPDGRQRPNHRALYERAFYTDSDEGRYYAPPLGFNCFDGSTEVSGRALWVSQGLYAGEFVEVATQGGRTLTVTSNHPLLTSRGWVAAHQLGEGEDLLCDVREVEHTLVGEVHVDDAPPRVEDAWHALRKRHGSARFRVVAKDLHGDAVGVQDGHIDVVDVTGELLRARQASGHQGGVDPVLSLSGPGATDEVGDCSLPLLGGSGDSSSGGLPRSPTLPLNRRAALLEHGPLEGLGVGARPGPLAIREPSISQNAKDDLARHTMITSETQHGGASAERGSNPRLGHLGSPSPDHVDAALLELLANGSLADVESAPNGDRPLPAGVATDRIIHIKRYSGLRHVYDLQTDTGLIVANGIYTSNCRCTSRTLSARQMERFGVTVTSGRISGVDPDPGWENPPMPLEPSEAA